MAREEIRVGIGNRVPNCAWDKEADFGRVEVRESERRREKSSLEDNRQARARTLIRNATQRETRMSLQRIYISSTALAVLVALCVLTASTVAQQQDEQKSNNRNSQSLSGSSSSSSFGAAGSSPNNDIYIDDEGLEGSGSRGEIRDDLEKEDDESSGSGYGDDDEDSSSITNSRSNANSNVGIHGGGGQVGGSQGGGHNNNQLGGGGDRGQGGSGDHADYDDEDDREDDDDLYTETKNPNLHNAVDPSTTDDEDMSAGTGKDGKSSGTSIKHSPDGDLEISQTQHITPTNGEGGAGGHGTGTGGAGHDSNNPYGGTGTGTGGSGSSGNGVLIMNAKNEDRTASFFAQPGILAAVIGGAVVGLLCAILVVMFIVYRMRKKDEGSYALDEPKRSPTANTYAKNANNREFYA